MASVHLPLRAYTVDGWGGLVKRATNTLPHVVVLAPGSMRPMGTGTW